MADDNGDESYFGSSVLPDPDADRRFSNMLFDLVGQVKDAQTRGLSPRDILDPASQHYIGDRLIAAHATTPSERLAAWADKVRKKYGYLRQAQEGAEDYLKRLTDSTGDAIESEPLPPLNIPEPVIPGTNIPDRGVPEGGWPGGHQGLQWYFDGDQDKSVPLLKAKVPAPDIDRDGEFEVLPSYPPPSPHIDKPPPKKEEDV